jgi:hypothetical protein
MRRREERTRFGEALVNVSVAIDASDTGNNLYTRTRHKAAQPSALTLPDLSVFIPTPSPSTTLPLE